MPHDCSVELSPLGYQFLTVVFENYDKDQDGALNKEELEELFTQFGPIEQVGSCLSTLILLVLGESCKDDTIQ